MSKTSTELQRHALNGPTMGTRWSALFFTATGFDAAGLSQALQAAVDEVDTQMSSWMPESDLSRINRAPARSWIEAPEQLLAVVRAGLEIGRASSGAFDIGLGDAVTAWGFGPEAASGEAIRTALSRPRRPSWEIVELADGRLRKHEAITLDLNGIAKGHAVDRLAETLMAFGITSFLAGVDGEMRAAGLRPDGEAWSIAIEQPDPQRRAAHSVITLEDAAIATSGDYRHWVEVKGHRLSHTMDPRRGAPLASSPASVTVVARTCMEADAWATALMVLGHDEGRALASRLQLNALFLLRSAQGEVRSCPVGTLFSSP